MKTSMFEKTKAGPSVVQLIYCSHAAGFENKAELERDLRDVLDRSRAYNPLHEITGALMADGEVFAHVIEGPSVAVADLYSKIRLDQRHNRVLTLQHTLVHVRLFNSWPIAFLRVGNIRHVRTLHDQSRPAEFRKASVSILKAFRPILLR